MTVSSENNETRTRSDRESDADSVNKGDGTGNQSSSTKSFTILALYKFVDSPMSADEVKKQKEEIECELRRHKALGAILLSTEGINGTICYPIPTEQTNKSNGSIDPVYQFLEERFPGLRTRISTNPEPVFFRLRVRIKDEIVTMGVPKISPVEKVGTYVNPGPDWDNLVNDPDCLVVDTRNDYEIEVGTFRHAVNPNTKSFTELPGWLEKKLKDSKAEKKPSKIAMFCTGGIRCEKATSYCLDLVEDQNIEVYHLKGGILAYLDNVPAEKSTFEGECYVFDQRTAVTYGLKPSEKYEQCHACRHPLTPQDRQHPNFQPGTVCPYCRDDPDREMRRRRYETRQMHLKVAQEKGIVHLGGGKRRDAFRISRSGIPVSNCDNCRKSHS